MTEPTYDDFYPEYPKSGMTAEQEAEYNQFHPGTFPEPTPKPTALEALTMALEAMQAGNAHDLSTPINKENNR